MSESTAVEAPAAKEPFFKMSSIPGANILVPLLLGCLLNTLFPDLFKTLGSFTLGMTQQGAGPLVGAFLLIVGTTISFKSAPAAAARGAIIIAVKQIVVVAMSLLILYVFNDNLFGISAMVMLAACTGANNAMYAGLMGTMGNEAERGAVAITTLVVGPPVTMIVLGAAGQAPIGWSLVGAILPIVVGIILGNLFPSFKKMMAPALSAIIVLVFFAMGSTMTFGQLINGGLPGILLGVICSVIFAIPVIAVDKLTGGTGVAGAAISSCAGANVATPAAMASVNGAMYGGAVLATATAQVAACAIVTAILTPLVTSWCYKHFEGQGNGDSKATADKAPQPPNAKRQSKLKTSHATGRPRGIPWPPCSFCRVSGTLYPAKAGITARANVVQRQGKITYKSVNGSCSRSHFLRVCKKRPYDIKKETYNSPDGEGRYVILLKRVKSWVLGCSSKVDKRFPCTNVW